MRFHQNLLSSASPQTISSLGTASERLVVAGSKGKRQLVQKEDKLDDRNRRTDDARNSYTNGDGVTRRIAWHLASDINIVAVFRLVTVAIGGVLVFLLSYVWHDVTGKIEGSVDASRMTNERISRTNERTNGLAESLAVLKSQVDDLRSERAR